MPAETLWQAVYPFNNDVLALPGKDINGTINWYRNAFGLEVAERFDDPLPTVIMERDNVKLGFAINERNPEEEGAAIKVTDIHRAKAELESNGIEAANWRIDEQSDGSKAQVFFVVAPDGLCYYFHQPL